MEYNKLVRDKIPEIIKNNGSKAVIHVADDDEYRRALKKKLEEETEEFLEEPSVEEAADVLEVLYAIAAAENVDLSGLDKARLEKNEKRGSFKDRIILERTD